MLHPTLRLVVKVDHSDSLYSPRSIEQAFFECYVPGRYGDETCPSVRYTMELTSFNGGPVEVYFMSDNCPIPIFVGHTTRLGRLGMLLEERFDLAMASPLARKAS